MALRIDAGQRFAAQELSFHRHHANRQQAGALVHDGMGGAFVQHQAAGQLQMIGQPLFARQQRGVGGNQLGANRLAVSQPR